MLLSNRRQGLWSTLKTESYGFLDINDISLISPHRSFSLHLSSFLLRLAAPFLRPGIAYSALFPRGTFCSVAEGTVGDLRLKAETLAEDIRLAVFAGDWLVVLRAWDLEEE